MKSILPIQEFWDSIGRPELVELGAEVADLGIDAMVDSGVVDSVPVVGWFVKGRRAGRAIRDELFFRKVVRFLAPIGQVDDTERREFAEEIRSNPRVAERVGEDFFLWLEQLNSMEKVPLLSRIFLSLLRGRITHDETRMLADVLDRAHLSYLKLLIPTVGASSFPKMPDATEVRTHLVSLGLASFDASWRLVDRQFKRDVSPRHVQLLQYDFTSLGRLFYKIVLMPHSE